MYKLINWENVDWSKLDERETEMYARWYREGRRQEARNWIVGLVGLFMFLFVVGCTVNIATEKEKTPDFCMGNMNDNGYCEVFWGEYSGR